jgi:hypothetical protein
MPEEIAMHDDTKLAIKIVVISATLIGLLMFIAWLTDPAMGQQPVTRDLDMRLSARDGQVYGIADEGGILPIGVWQVQLLQAQRGGRSRFYAFHTLTNGGENLLFSYRQGSPSRTNDGVEVNVIEFPGSAWVPLSGKGRLWELPGGDYRIVVKVALVGGP